MFNFIIKELFLTYDIEIYRKAIEKLAQNGIKYYVKTRYIGSRGNRGSMMGTFGENDKVIAMAKVINDNNVQ